MPRLAHPVLCMILLALYFSLFSLDSGAHAQEILQDIAADAGAAAAPSAGWLSLLPALLAISLAMVTRQVYLSLFIGVLSGAWLVNGVSAGSFIPSVLDVLDTYILQALVPADGDSEHMAIILFTLTTGAMIGVVSKNGGMEGLVARLITIANTRRKGGMAGIGMGALIFFDDYSNTLIVGNSMRPLFDKLKISREKLAFIVDATAAPLATVAVITTWNGFQLSLINDVLPSLPEMQVSGYEMLINAVPYMLYPLLMLGLVVMSVLMQRDFGAMYKAEKVRFNAKNLPIDTSEIIVSDDNTDVPAPLSINAVLPILTLAGVTVAGLFITGEGTNLREILGSASPITAMLWGSLISLIVAITLSVATGRLTLTRSFEAMERGMHPMLMAVVILTLAWAIADVNAALGTADYIVSQLGEALDPTLLPALIFLIAAGTAFATGTSWGTMGILIPVVLPLCVSLLTANDMFAPEHYSLLYATLASVLAGAVWGDHCSPISDTTILSSIASRCDHIAHVRTQLPYAMIVGVLSVALLWIVSATGVSALMALIIGTLLLYAVLKWRGKNVA